MIIEEFSIETSTWSGNSEYPEKSGYGNQVEVKFKYNESTEDINTASIAFDGKLYVIGDFELIIEEYQKFKSMIAYYNTIQKDWQPTIKRV